MARLDRLLAWWGRSPATETSLTPGHVPPNAMPASTVQHRVLDGMYLGAMQIGPDEVELFLNDGRRLRITRADVPMVRAALQSLDRTTSGSEELCSDRASSAVDASESSARLRQEPGNRS